MEREITSPVQVADARGRLAPEAVGWARHPSLLPCRLPRGIPRVHRWNHWCVTTRTHALTITIADLGLFGLVVVQLLEYARGAPVERVVVRPWGLPVRLGDSPRDDVVLAMRRLRLAMRAKGPTGETMRVEGEARTLRGTRLAIDLAVDRPHAHETLNVVVPFGDPTRFQMTSKQQGLPARGVVRVDGRELPFGPENDALACMDFGHGRWPPRIAWHWAFASGRAGGRTFGFNLGGTWTDGSGVTENGFVLDGRLHKIAEEVAFEHDARDFTRPWRVRSVGGDRVDLRLRPLHHRALKLPLGLVDLHHVFGTYTGTLVTAEGERVHVDGATGFAERFRGRW
jgi:hypothetical protein